MNFGGSHAASSKGCDAYRFEAEVASIRNKVRLTFDEAKAKVKQRFIPPRVAVAAALFRSTGRWQGSLPAHDKQILSKDRFSHYGISGHLAKGTQHRVVCALE